MKYRDEKFYWTYQHGVGWPDDYVGPDSLDNIIEKSEGFPDSLDNIIEKSEGFPDSLDNIIEKSEGFPDSLDNIIEKSQGFTYVGLYRISESVRAYAYLILSSQASVRSTIIGNTVSALTTQKAFMNNFENVVTRKVNIREDITRYQDTLSYTSSKVDYSMGENI